MGCWGEKPFDNDAAADWFGDFFERYNFLPFIEETLNLDHEEYFEEIRAAAYVVVQFGHTYIWPVDEIDKFNLLAIEKLKLIKELEELQEDSDIVKEIEKEIDLLQSRID